MQGVRMARMEVTGLILRWFAAAEKYNAGLRRRFLLVIPAKAGQARSTQNGRRPAPEGRAQRVIHGRSMFQTAKATSMDLRLCGDDAAAKAFALCANASLHHFTLTSLTSNTTAWFAMRPAWMVEP